MLNTSGRLLLAGVVWIGRTLVAAEPDPELEILKTGVKLTLVAEHPQLATPTGIDVDCQGRLWVVATHTHFRPEDYEGPEHDEVLIFTDRDGDGRAEHREVFYNATVATMDLELGPHGWVYLAERDRILRIRDSDGDGQADQEEDLAVLQTSADYPHNGLEGLAWHPNGELIFSLGENYAKPWTLTAADGTVDHGTGEGGVFRCTADGRKLQRIARGFWNPFGICVRDDGEIFAAENDPGARPPCRLLHVVEGGDYGYQRKYGPEAHHPFVCWNGELRGTLPMIHPTGEAPCGVQPLRSGILATTWTDHRIDFYPLQRRGASYTATRVVLVRGGNSFRPVCLTRQGDRRGTNASAGRAKASVSADPDVATFYFTDWVHVSYQLHGMGRIWKMDLDLPACDWLPAEQDDYPNDATVSAERLRRGAEDVRLAALLEAARDSDPFLAQAAIVGLSRRASMLDPDTVVDWSESDRVTAVQALKTAALYRGEDVAVTEWIRRLLEDSSSDVLYETLRWIADGELVEFLPDVERLLDRDGLDFQLFEAILATRNTLRGNAEAGVRDSELLLRQVTSESASPQIRAFALRLLPTVPRVARDGETIPRLSFPKGLTVEILRDLLDAGDGELAREAVRTLAGNPVPDSVRVLVDVASDVRQPLSVRLEAICGLAAVAADHRDLLLQLAVDSNRSLREEALRALRRIEPTAAERTMLQRMAMKYPASRDLVDLILDPAGVQQSRPDVKDTDGWIRHLAMVMEPADPEAGERIFRHSQIGLCTRCHRHEGRGNVVGPDLSQAGRRNDSRWLLESILQPNRSVAPEYRARTLVLTDGRVFTGIHLRTGGSSDTETLRDSNGQERRFPRAEIEASHEVMTSLMPEGLTAVMTTRELRDLLSFLARQPH